MKAFLSICLFGALFSPGAPITCYDCMGEGCATPDIKECDNDDDTCVSIVTQTTLVNAMLPKYNLTEMHCGQRRYCFPDYISSSTVGGANFRTNSLCCDDDLCNNMTVSLPETEDRSFNDVICPACFGTNSSECEDNNPMQCTGEETRCITVTATLYIGFMDEKMSVYFQGCATPTACNFTIPEQNSTPMTIKLAISDLQCTDEMSGETGESKSLSSLESTIPGQGPRSWRPRG